MMKITIVCFEQYEPADKAHYAAAHKHGVRHGAHQKVAFKK